MFVKLLDCTLRDGGHVNQANFGKEIIKGIISDLIDSNIDIIELGFLKNGEFNDEQAFFNKLEDVYKLLPENKQKEYSIMIRPDKYDIKQLNQCNGIIQNIRFAFYYKDIEITRRYCDY